MLYLRNRAALGVLAAVSAVASLSGSAWGALTINLTYGAGFSGAGATAVQRRVTADAAKAMWQSQFAVGTVAWNVDITVAMADLSGEGATTTGRMRNNTQSGVNVTTNTRLPASGVAEMDSNRTWFFDQTPNDNSEYTMNAGGLRGVWNGATPAPRDALTTLLHEMGHVLGFSGGTGTWNDGTPFTSYTDFRNNINAGGSLFTFDTITSGREGSINGPITTVAMADVFHVGPANRLMNPTRPDDTRQLITPLEADMICDAFNLCGTVPAPGSASVVILGLMAFSRRRRSVRV